MEKFNRAVRRHHVARLKKTRKFYYGYGNWDGRGEMSPAHLGKVVQYPANCSCWMCGNPRKMLNDDTPKGITIQELKHLNFFEDSLKECLQDLDL